MAVATVAVVLGLAPGIASASVPITKLVAEPISASTTCSPSLTSANADAPAATHRDYCVAFSVAPGTDDVKKLTISLPAGVVGDPGATPRCTFPADNSSAGNCTSSNQVGTVSATAQVDTVLDPTLNLTGEIYNITPAAGEPARLGIALHPNPSILGIGDTFLQTSIRVRVPDAGLDSITDNVPNTASGLPITLTSQSMTLWGTKTHHPSMAKPFMTLPTRCDVPATSTVTIGSYNGQNSSASSAFTVTDCAAVPFTPDLEVGPTTAPADTPGEAWAKLIVPAADTGSGDNARRQGYLKDVALQLPAGLALNPPLANGLIPCTPEQFGQDRDAPPECPESTVMGRVEFQTPIFPGETLTGKVYFGQPLPGKPLVNYISVEDPRLRVKLVGYATIDPDTTAITAHFENQPQVPFSSFRFIYTDPGDGRATLTSPVTCGTYSVTAAMTPWAGPQSAPTKTFDVNDCPPKAFTPTVGASVSTTQAGADTAFSVHIERPDRQLRLEQINVSLPPGLTGRLTAVPHCAVADARAASCPDASQVGTAAVSVGTGPAPLKLPGKVYLTDGFDNAIAGLAVVVDTKVPALDLGKVAVLQKLILRPDTGIDVVSENLPQKLQGIPTVYRTIDLTIDKPGFMRNATSCAAQNIHATLNSVGGEMSASSDVPYQATGCENLPFNPKLTAKLGAPGEDAKGKHPPLQVTIQQADGEAAMQKTVVTLPEGIGVDLKNLGGLCNDDQLNSGTCPANSKIGDVSAETPLLPTRLSGGVYLMKPRVPGLPDIALDLGLVRLKGAVTIKGRLTTTFDAVPDVPLTRLVLNLTGGPKGSLATSVDQCAAKPAFDASFTSHAGMTRTATIPAEVVGCGASAAASSMKLSGSLSGVKRRKPVLRLALSSPTTLRELRLSLPSSLRPISSKRVKKATLLLGGRRLKGASVRYSKGRLSFRTPKGKSTRSFRITLGSKVLRMKKRIKVGQRVTLRLTAVGSNGKAIPIRVTLRARK